MASGSPRRAYIHIGPGKTGSTSVQAYFRHNREKLRQRGLLVPSVEAARGNIMQNHVKLAKCDELTDGGEIKRGGMLWRQVEAEIADGKSDILLSSEHYKREFLKPGDVFGRICAFFERRGYRPVVIAYIRDQPAWLNSRYVQNQSRLFDQISMDDFVTRTLEEGGVDPWQYLKPYIDNPDCDLKIIPFETSAKRGLETDFLTYCGIEDFDGMEDTGLKRPNAGAKTVYASQLLMARLDHKVYKLDKYKRGIKTFNRWKAELGWDQIAYSDMTPARVRRIKKHFAETNEAFAQRFLGTSWEQVCPTKSFKRSVFDPKKASPEELEEIERVVKKVLKKFRKLKEKSEAADDAED